MRAELVREFLWEELSQCFCSFNWDNKVSLLGDLNLRAGDEEIRGIASPLGVESYENGKNFWITCCWIDDQ